MTVATMPRKKERPPALRKDFPHKPPGFPSDYTDEEFIASGLVSGYCNIDTKGRFLGVWYLTGAHERLGLEMLAHVLRSKKAPPRYLLRKLADLFDPGSEDPRKLEFKFRNRKRPNPERDRAIAFFVEQTMQRSGRLKNDVVENEAAPYFELSREAVYEALARDKKRYPNLPIVVSEEPSDATD
jgi:hypothetical protein